MTLIGGPHRPELPYRWGCVCGALWNSDKPDQPTGRLCGPFCNPVLFELGDNVCSNCLGGGSVPNPVYNPEEALDGPYIQCPACDGTGEVK